MSDNTDVIKGSLVLNNFQEGRTYSNMDDFVQSLAEIFSIEIPTKITNVIVSSTEPGDDFKEGVWIRRNTAGNFVGMYLFQSGTWTKVFPEAVVSATSTPTGVDTGLWVEVDANGSFEKLWAYQNNTWLQLYPDPDPPDYAAIFAEYYRSTIWGGVSASGGNNYFITTVPEIESLTVPTTISFIPDADNTGSSTLNVNGLGAITIIDSSGSNLSGGELQESVITEVTYDGVNWVVSIPAELNGAYITDGSIATAKLVDSAVTTAKIADAAIIASKLGISSVSETRIAPLAVTTAKIADAAVTAAKLAAAGVTTDKILDGAVTTDKLAANAVTEAKIATGAVTATKIDTNAVITAKIKDLAITDAKIAHDAITAYKLNPSVAGNGLGGAGGSSIYVNVDNSTIQISSDTLRVKDLGIIAAKLGSQAVETAKIKDLNVTEAKLANSAVTTNKISNGAVTGAKLASAVSGEGLTVDGSGNLAVNVDGSTIEHNSNKIRVKSGGIAATHLAANSVDTSELVNDSVTNDKIASNAVNADSIAANSVDTSELVDGAVTPAKTDFTWDTIVPTVTYMSGNPIFAGQPDQRRVDYMILGKLLIITFEIADTSPDYFSSGENGLLLSGITIAGSTIYSPPKGSATYNIGEPSPCWYDYSLNTITIPFETVLGNFFTASSINAVSGTIVAALS